MVAVVEGPTTRAACGRCEALPAPPSDRGTLYLVPPLAHTAANLAALLRRHGARFAESTPGILAVALEPGQLASLASALGDTLSPREMADTRSLVVTTGGSPTLADALRAEPLDRLVAKAQAGWLVDLLREGRLDTHFQPIVDAADPARVFGHEALARGRDRAGGPIPPGAMFAAAAGAELLFQLDRATRIGAIRAYGRLGLAPAGRVFVNFNPTSIYGPVYCLRSTAAAAAEAGIAPERIVFEVVESDQIRDRDRLVDILTYYRRAGFGIALDDLGAGYGSLTLLERLRPDVVKLDMALTRDVDRNPFKAIIAQKLLEAARELGIRTVAEGVETVAEWRWLRDHGADLVQGFLFARPGNPPPAPVVPDGG